MKKQAPVLTAVILALLLIGVRIFAPSAEWTAAEMQTLRSLWLGSLPALSPNLSNRVADDPRAVALGHQLFFDTRFSANGKVACASCHMPELNFQDARAHGRGIAETRRRTPGIVGAAYLTRFFWDGRKDSEWSQALAPLEGANEHGGDRAQDVHLIGQLYRDEYESLFGALPDMSRVPPHAGPNGDAEARAAWAEMPQTEQEAVTRTFANLGKVLEAYERKLVPGESRFDQYVGALLQGEGKGADEPLSSDEVAGLRLFIGKAGCVKCHNTPLFTDNDFHNTGVPQDAETEHDAGRAEGAVQYLNDEFKCLGEYSDDPARNCPALRDMETRGAELTGAFKTPSLRKTMFVSPFMHNAWYTRLSEVLDHYNRAPAAMVGESELKPLNLSPVELKQLEAFLQTLTAPVNAPPELLRDPFEAK